jgi:hypothetical protein
MKLASLLFAAFAVGAPALAQDPAPKPPEEIKRLESWPEITPQALQTVRTDVQRLRKARTPEMSAEAEAALVGAGAGIVPELLPTLAKEKDGEAVERVQRVLTAVTSAEHTRLLARYFEDKSPEVRVFALRRCAAFPDPGVRESAEAALARVAKQGDKADPMERYAAALATTSSGSLAGFDILADSARTSWAKRGPEMRAALEALRGPEAAGRGVALLAGERDDVLAGLSLLSGCGDKASAAQIKKFLDSDDHQIRVAAINALRGIVEGAPPLDKLPVFEAIELAKEWKARV